MKKSETIILAVTVVLSLINLGFAIFELVESIQRNNTIKGKLLKYIE